MAAARTDQVFPGEGVHTPKLRELMLSLTGWSALAANIFKCSTKIRATAAGLRGGARPPLKRGDTGWPY